MVFIVQNGALCFLDKLSSSFLYSFLNQNMNYAWNSHLWRNNEFDFIQMATHFEEKYQVFFSFDNCSGFIWYEKKKKKRKKTEIRTEYFAIYFLHNKPQTSQLLWHLRRNQMRLLSYEMDT